MNWFGSGDIDNKTSLRRTRRPASEKHPISIAISPPANALFGFAASKGGKMTRIAGRGGTRRGRWRLRSRTMAMRGALFAAALFGAALLYWLRC